VLLLQQLVNGVIVGGAYALCATGLSITLGVAKVLNVAHGITLTIAAIAGAEFARRYDLGTIAFLAVGALAGACIGAALELLAYRPIRSSRRHDRHTFDSATLVSGMAMLLILSGGLRLFLNRKGAHDIVSFPSSGVTKHRLSAGSISVPLIGVVILVTAAVLVGATWWLVERTQWGRACRAMALDHEAARMIGINVDLMSALLLALSGAMAGVAGGLVGLAYRAVDGTTGDQYLLLGFAVVVLGGIGSVPGAFIGALLVGLVQGLTAYWLGSQWVQLVAFVFLFAMLVVRPHGLLGTAPIDRA
jgi:branched-chain amino acid transport system permease protein